MNQQRRIVLKGLAVTSLTALGATLLPLGGAWAAWPKEAFTSDSLEGALGALFDAPQAEDSDQIDFKAPDIAENGAVVPVSVTTSLANVESISILVVDNPTPLAAQFIMTPASVPEVSTRIKMGKTSNVVALVRADGKLYQTSKEVKVTIGGCGG